MLKMVKSFKNSVQSGRFGHLGLRGGFDISDVHLGLYLAVSRANNPRADPRRDTVARFVRANTVKRGIRSVRGILRLFFRGNGPSPAFRVQER